tara:strand:- start:3645 stop:5990 length:2346 start_codon:yes stop_codon:yes gene_type:complete
MAQFKTRLRLNQVTGSLGDFEGGIIDTRGAGSATLADVAILSGSMVGILSELASSVKRITGAGSFAAGVAGQFDQDLVVAGTTPKITIGDGGAEDSALVFDGNVADFYVGLDDSADKLVLGLGSAVGTTPNMELNSADRAVKFFGGVIAEGAIDANSTSDFEGAMNLQAGITVAGAIDANSTSDFQGAMVLQSSLTAAGVIDSNLATDASDATGQTGAIQTLGGVSIAKKLYVGTDLDVDGVSNLDVVDIDGAVDMASTLQVDGVLTTTAAAVSTGGMLVGTDSHISFRDAQVYAASLADGSLDLVADAEIHLVAPALNFDGAADISGNLTIGGDFIVNGTTTTVNSSTVQIDDLNLQLADGAAAASAVNGGGLTLATSGDDFTWNYNHASTSWKSSIDVDAASGKAYKIAGASVLNATTLGSAVVNSSLTSLGTQAESLVMGSNAITGAGAIGAASLTATGVVTAAGLTVGSAVLVAAELEMIDGITAGTAAASKAMVLDADSDISGGRNLTISGELDAATGDFSGLVDIDGSLDVAGTTNLDVVDIDGALQIDAAFTSGVDGTGYDSKFFGDTASAYMLWDASADDLILGGAAGLIVPEGQLVLGSTAMTSTAAELNLLDNVAGLVQADFTKLAAVDATAAELNIMDGGTSASSVTLADADRLVVNDDGVMKQINMVQVAAYMQSYLTQKQTYTVPTTIAANSDFALGSMDADFGTSYHTALPFQKDVYVNGQLMAEGANLDSNLDFYPGTGNSGNVRFEFALEPGDVIQVILRAGDVA